MNWIAIFRTGKHTDSSGETREWSREDLDRIVEKYDPQRHEAPVVIGHPKTNAPAWGWVEALKREGDILYAKIKDLVPEFTEMLKKKMFKKRSISLYPDLTLRHVGFLGAMPPAVKGLPDFEFREDGEAITIEFSEWRIPVIGRVLARLREFLIDKFDLETADRVISPYEIEELTREPEAEPSAPAFSEEEPKNEEPNMPTIEELQQQLEEQKRQLTEFTEKIDEMKREKETLQQQLEAEKRERQRKEFSDFCDTLIEEGKLLPAQKEKAVFLMETLAETTAEFAEGENKKSAPELFREFLQSLPKQLETGEIATAGKAAEGGNASHDFSGTVDEERLEIHNKAMQLVSEKNMDYREALLRVLGN